MKTTTTNATLAAKLHPSRFPNMSAKMAALVGLMVGEQFTTPHLIEATVTVDGMVLARRHDDLGFNEFIGSVEDLRRNFVNLIHCATLSLDETALAHEAFRREFGIDLLKHVN